MTIRGQKLLCILKICSSFDIENKCEEIAFFVIYNFVPKEKKRFS